MKYNSALLQTRKLPNLTEDQSKRQTAEGDGYSRCVPIGESPFRKSYKQEKPGPGPPDTTPGPPNTAPGPSNTSPGPPNTESRPPNTTPGPPNTTPGSPNTTPGRPNTTPGPPNDGCGGGGGDGCSPSQGITMMHLDRHLKSVFSEM